MTTISLTDSFGGMEIPGFTVSVLPEPAPVIVLATSLPAGGDFDESVTDLPDSDAVEEDDDEEEDV